VTGGLSLRPEEAEAKTSFGSFEELEADDAAVAGALYAVIASDEHSAIKEAAQREGKRFGESTDGSYYFCMVFQSQDARDEFLQHTGWADPGTLFLCGEDVARTLRVPLATPVPPMPKFRSNRKLVELTDLMHEE